MSRTKTLAALALLVLLGLASALRPAAAGGPPQPHLVPTKLAAEAAAGAEGTHARAPPASPQLQPATNPSYDEQLGSTFTQSFTSMLYNVTAVPQSDPVSQVGPAYLLNGLTGSGYWYQVGLSWNWIFPFGFGMNYEVFGPGGNSVFPSNGEGGLDSFSGIVNPGDNVSLNLYFGSGQVVMLAEDSNTGASAEQTYGAQGASSFVGLPTQTADSNGYFTGLMTEWYHPTRYLGDEQKVTYTTSLALSSSWMWADEFECADANCTSQSLVFSDTTPAPVAYNPPDVLVPFSSNGAHMYSSAYQFITGSVTLVPLTLSYSVQGGGTPGAPTVSYYQGGVRKTGTLTAAGSTFYLDRGSSWSVSGTLPGAAPGERWATDQQTSGTATSPFSAALDYYHQYFVNFTIGVEGGGTGYSLPTVSFTQFGSANGTVAGTETWADAGSAATYPASLPGSTATERWTAVALSAAVDGPGQVQQSYVHQYYISVSLAPSGGGHVSASSGWLDAGEEAAFDATATPGWAFGLWTGTGAGSYSGSSSSAPLQVVGPINESAVFYPGLTVAVVGSGSVSYSYGGAEGVVSSGSQTIFAAGGTPVTLAASPASIFYSFTGWKGALQGTGASRQVATSDPESVTATFGYNIETLGGALAAAVAVGVAALALSRAARRKPAAAGAPPEA
ncbi:MAG: hypothetical protein JRN57_04060 [Nitrososphaerota archaeon]|nr:hypothetical protein [Nitrososphaerota archaeon]